MSLSRPRTTRLTAAALLSGLALAATPVAHAAVDDPASEREIASSQTRFATDANGDAETSGKVPSDYEKAIDIDSANVSAILYDDGTRELHLTSVFTGGTPSTDENFARILSAAFKSGKKKVLISAFYNHEQEAPGTSVMINGKPVYDCGSSAVVEDSVPPGTDSTYYVYSIVIPSTCVAKATKPLRAKKVRIDWETRVTTQDGIEIYTSDSSDLSNLKPIKL